MSYEAWSEPEDHPFEAAIEAGWLDPDDLSKALIDVMNERDRQRNVEGWTPEHDDAHAEGDLAAAGAAYASHNRVAALWVGAQRLEISGRALWPWSRRWWKPTDRRRDLVKAAALILAEIERLDRAEAKAKAESGS